MAPYMEKTEKMPLELPDYYNQTFGSCHIVLYYSGRRHPASSCNYYLTTQLTLHCLSLKCPKRQVHLKCQGWPCSVTKFLRVTHWTRRNPPSFKFFKRNLESIRRSLICGKKTVNRIRLRLILASYKKKWDIQDSKIDATYKMKFSVDEFAHDHLDEDKTRKEVEKFLSKELTKDFNEGDQENCKKPKVTPVGFGRSVRAFHPHLWNKGKWQDTFSELDINVKVEAEITRTGILN